ncbi:MAG: fumarate hydratase [Methanomicrobia archaeon]|nr:fumarate hydratase [Methanomicrobia archaeon]
MITKERIKEVTVNLLQRAETSLPEDVNAALRSAYERETSEIARVQLAAMLENIRLAEYLQRPICQDTGLPIVFLKLGRLSESLNLGDVEAGIREGVAAATEQIPLRSNVVDPITRQGAGGNLGDKIPYINYAVDPALDGLELTVFPKGGGSENMSRFTMLTPRQNEEALNAIKAFVLETVVEAGGKPCPPTIVGVGVGGSTDLAMKLAKLAVLRPIGERNKEDRIARLETELLDAVNRTGIGPMGLGGATTALDVHIETAGTHITGLPVAVNFQCWSARQASATIHADGKVEYKYVRNR